MEELKTGRYKHYKGNYYEILGTVTHSETLENMVLYKQLYGEGALWVRPLAMFFENIQVQGRSVPRFEYAPV